MTMTLTITPDLVEVLAPQVERLFERHLATTKSWMPHELVPWERAAESAPRGEWDAANSTLPAGVRSALRRQPAHRGQPALLLRDHQPDVRATTVWREWARRWIAEEMRHAIVIRDYITVTHAVDLDALERGAHAPGVRRRRCPQPDIRRRHARVRRAAGAGDAHLAPQHRERCSTTRPATR